MEARVNSSFGNGQRSCVVFRTTMKTACGQVNISGMARPADSITQALDNWMDRVQDANPEVHFELLTDEQQDDLYNTVVRLCLESELHQPA